MTTITDWKALLAAQLECLEALSEDDIKRINNDHGYINGYFRHTLLEPWKGPMSLTHVDYETMYPFGSMNTAYRLFTKTLPIEPQTVTLIPWSGGECPVSSDTLVIVKLRKLWLDVAVAGYYTPYQWEHSEKSIYDHDIIAYRPITIDIEEG